MTKPKAFLQHPAVLLLILCFLYACKGRNKGININILPGSSIPVLYQLPEKYKRITVSDTLINQSDSADKVILHAIYMPGDSVKANGLDTMDFTRDNIPAAVEGGYNWFFGGLTYNTDYKRDKNGVEKEIYTRISSRAFLNRYVKQQTDSLLSDPGSFNMNVNAVMGPVVYHGNRMLYSRSYPILKKVRIKDSYYKLGERDSVAVKNYIDKIDSVNAVYIKFWLSAK